jgi:hypothetical protein
VERFKEKMKEKGSVRRVVAAELDSEDLESKGSKNKRATNTPVLFAIELERRFGGDNKTTDELHDLFDWLDTKLADGTIEDLPAFEAVLDERPQDMEQLQAQKKRRDAATKSLRMKVPTGPTPASEQTTESENTPTHRPDRAPPKNVPPPVNGSGAANGTSPSKSQADVSAIREAVDPVCTDLSITLEESTSNVESSARISSSAPSKIILKLKGKKPVRADSIINEAQPRITKKRKRVTVATREDSKNEGESAAPTKKPKVAKLVVKAAKKQSAPLEEVAEGSTVGTISDGQTQTSGEQHMKVTNGSTRLACLTFGDLKIIINFAPGS